MQILIAEEEPYTYQLLQDSLNDGNYDVLHVANGQAAWDLIQTTPISMIIADWNLPLLNGSGLVQRIRANYANGSIYIILLANSHTTNEVIRQLKAGADDYLMKPVDSRELAIRLSIGTRILRLENGLREARDLSHFLANHDNATGLLNQDAIVEHARAEIVRTERLGKPVSMVLMSIDQFTDIRNRYGYVVGEQALRSAGQKVTRATRPYDWIGRWQGDQMMLILPGTMLAEAGVVAERIRHCVAGTPINLPDGTTTRLSASLGVSSTSLSIGSVPSLDDLLQDATTALVRAQHDGHNRVCLAIVHYIEG